MWSGSDRNFKWTANIYVGFVVLTTAVMKTYNVWYMTPYSPLKINRRFRGICRLHLEGSKNKPSEIRWLNEIYEQWTIPFSSIRPAYSYGSSLMFRRTTLSPSSGLKNTKRALRKDQTTIVCLAYFRPWRWRHTFLSNVNNLYRTTQRHVPEVTAHLLILVNAGTSQIQKMKFM
jgi:hypothetical protein